MYLSSVGLCVCVHMDVYSCVCKGVLTFVGECVPMFSSEISGDGGFHLIVSFFSSYYKIAAVNNNNKLLSPSLDREMTTD